MIGPAANGAEEAPPPPCAACLVWESCPEEAARLLDRPGRLDGLEILVHGPAAGAPGSDLLRALAARGARVGLVVPLSGGTPAAEVMPGVVTALIDARTDDGLAADALAFRVKTRATELRSALPGLSVGLEAPPDVLAALWDRGLAAYVDFAVQPASVAPGPSVSGLSRWGRLSSARAQAVDDVLAATRTSSFERLLAPWPADAEVALALAALRDVLPAGLSPLRGVAVTCEGGPERAAEVTPCRGEVFLHPATLEAVVVVRPERPTRSVWVRPTATRVELFPLAPAAERQTLHPQAGAAAARVDVPALASPFVLRIAGWAGQEGRFSAGLDVVEERTLTVEEVIARHQASLARQRQRVRRLIASGHTVLAFQAPGLASPLTVTAETVLYVDGDATEIEQRTIRLNGMDLVAATDSVPRLPIVEPERVSRPPLAITLTEAYRYRLVGRERVGARDSYVVEFEPRDASQPLFRGRAWIDARGFAMVRSAAAQTALRGPIVSSEQVDEFTPVAVGGETAWLLARSEVSQVYEGAGHRTPLHRVVTLDRHEANPPDFEARLQAAHASPSVMLRDTPEGFRYLRRVRRGEEAPAAATRVVVPDRASRVRTLAMGALVDPNISTPLPFAGLSYLDFDFLGTGAQVNAFFAISFVQAAWAVPSVGGTRWQLHGSGFATLAEYNDRAFRQGLERYDENVRQRPARVTMALVRPLSPRLRARLGYELGYTRLRRSHLTASDFQAPVSPLVHALRLSLEGQRGPWTAAVWWSPARRQRWTTWGRAGNSEAAPDHIDFQRFGASAARSFVFSTSALARLEAAWMAGSDLDRFSRYSFDAFENPLRGYPSAALRFDHGAVLRTVFTWQPAPRLRLDAFADTARVHDPGFGPGLRSYSGLGGGVEVPLPWRALFSAEWGYGFQGRDREGGKGTHVFRLTAYKIF